ncbi:deoxyribonuclease IV [Ileibacterium valens]|uniref:Probable endonuclease 4 n=1 Tax=Ileibacterium valens TaxID=1862668 RepID=A0A1U7NER9_9FIRM|nr:deoxyribonuclease IV [Ileibacterium valens]OLU38283.1 deoxyribonuclease IV [Ileibacterium valens]OLU42499.1 deoxyribonuclease IV [Erysipelotrichaceae bacterium NYU-BL-F16]OLU43049.1 deoxyribonuclease IV [Erysipelotrichaceae bacterium NYU-BL-E8]
MLKIGSHVGLKAPDYFLGSIKEAISYDANACMVYTGAPQNSKRKPVSQFKVEEARKLMEENQIEPSSVIIHAPYIINLGNTVKPETAEFGVEFLQEELRRVKAIGSNLLVLHPGAHLKAGVEMGIESIVKGLDEVFSQDDSDIVIALETMAGKGTEVGSTFQEIRTIIDRCSFPERLGVCLDTCHIHDAGYDVANFDAILDEFDQVIGLSRLKVLHINDSKNIRGARKDRHENIGKGEIGLDALAYVVHHPRLESIVKILETPYIDDKAPYKEEIDLLRYTIPSYPQSAYPE